MEFSFFLFPKNKGIYKAISGNFLDAHNLSLLNPYMVSVLFSVLAQKIRYFNFLSSGKKKVQNLYYDLIIAAQLQCFLVVHRAMSAKQETNVPPDFINELLYANFRSMQLNSYDQIFFFLLFGIVGCLFFRFSYLLLFFLFRGQAIRC